MHAHLLSTQLVLDTFDTGFKSTRNRIEIKILVSSQTYQRYTTCIVLSMASFLNVIILGVADVQKMALAGGHRGGHFFLLSVSCPFCEVQRTSSGAVCSWKGRLLVRISQAAQLLCYTLK